MYNDLKSKKENNETPNWDDVKNRLKGNEDTKKKILERLENAWNNGYFVDDEVKNSLNFLNNFLLQLGGDETTGKGYVRVKFTRVINNLLDKVLIINKAMLVKTENLDKI